VPDGFNGTDQIRDGAPDEPSFDFHNKYAPPEFGSTKGLGSSTPPLAGSQYPADPELSVNWGNVVVVATERQLCPESAGLGAWEASYHMTQCPP
jgi:hypothetical protein